VIDRNAPHPRSSPRSAMQGSLLLCLWVPLASGLASGLSAPMRGSSRFFLDTAVREELTQLLPLGMFHGVTTNPTILQRSGVPCTVEAIHELAKDVYELGAQEFMCQAWGSTADEMFVKGIALATLPGFPAPVIKVPVTPAGVEAAAQLQANGVRVCLTACYASSQALVAASLGCEYLAPYLGRMTDAGKNGFGEIAKMQEIVDGLGASTRIFVASIRTVDSMAELATLGLNTFTFSPDIARALFVEPLTIEAARAFEEAAASNQGE